MANDSGTVVFVGVPDLVKITGRTRARFSQLVREMDAPNSVLPRQDALVNNRPMWRLDSIVARLENSGFPVSATEVQRLRRERSVPAATVPVGVAESAEALGITERAMRGRSESGITASVLYNLARDRVWDLNAVVADARGRGFGVDEAAVAKWRQSNGGPRYQMDHEGVATLKVRFSVLASSPSDATAQISAVVAGLDNLKNRVGTSISVSEATLESVDFSSNA
jgi:hypothetical protein